MPNLNDISQIGNPNNEKSILYESNERDNELFSLISNVQSTTSYISQNTPPSSTAPTAR